MEDQNLEQEREFWRNNVDKITTESTTLDTGESQPSTKDVSISKDDIPEAKTEVASEEKEAVKDTNVRESERSSDRSPKDNSDDTFKKPEILKEKSAKERSPERLKITWEEANRAKAEVQKEREAIKAERESLKKSLEEEIRMEFKKLRPDLHEIKPETWNKLAEQKEQQALEARNNGRIQEAKRLDSEAYDCRKEARKIENDLQTWNQQEEQRKKQVETYQGQIKEHQAKIIEDIKSEFPELEKLDSPIRKQLDHYYKDPGLAQFFNSHPNGYWYATHLADLSARAETASVLAEKVTELETQLKKLNKGRTPSISYDNGEVKEKNLANAPLDKQRQIWRNEFAKLDRYGAAA